MLVQDSLVDQLFLLTNTISAKPGKNCLTVQGPGAIGLACQSTFLISYFSISRSSHPLVLYSELSEMSENTQEKCMEWGDGRCEFCRQKEVDPAIVGETYSRGGLTVHQFCLVSSA